MASNRWNLHGKSVLITGAARGIGAVTARLLAGCQARLSLVNMHGPALQQLAGDLGETMLYQQADITQRDAIEEAVAATVERFGVTALADWYFFGLGVTMHRHNEMGTCETLYRWFALDDLQDIDLYPTFLQDALLALPSSTEHIVLIDEEMPVLSTVPVFLSDALLN